MRGICLFLLLSFSYFYLVVEAAEKTHYEILGLSQRATAKQIRTSYHKLAKQHHPDSQKKHGKNNQEAQSKFLEISKAYEVLIDDISRRSYDQSLHLTRQAPQKNSLFRGVSDFASKTSKFFYEKIQKPVDDGDYFPDIEEEEEPNDDEHLFNTGGGKFRYRSSASGDNFQNPFGAEDDIRGESDIHDDINRIRSLLFYVGLEIFKSLLPYLIITCVFLYLVFCPMRTGTKKLVKVLPITPYKVKETKLSYNNTTTINNYNAVLPTVEVEAVTAIDDASVNDKSKVIKGSTSLGIKKSVSLHNLGGQDAKSPIPVKAIKPVPSTSLALRPPRPATESPREPGTPVTPVTIVSSQSSAFETAQSRPAVRQERPLSMPRASPTAPQLVRIKDSLSVLNKRYIITLVSFTSKVSKILENLKPKFQSEPYIFAEFVEPGLTAPLVALQGLTLDMSDKESDGESSGRPNIESGTRRRAATLDSQAPPPMISFARAPNATKTADFNYDQPSAVDLANATPPGDDLVVLAKVKSYLSKKMSSTKSDSAVEPSVPASALNFRSALNQKMVRFDLVAVAKSGEKWCGLTYDRIITNPNIPVYGAPADWDEELDSNRDKIEAWLHGILKGECQWYVTERMGDGPLGYPVSYISSRTTTSTSSSSSNS